MDVDDMRRQRVNRDGLLAERTLDRVVGHGVAYALA
jgi:hypothetical protein